MRVWLCPSAFHPHRGGVEELTLKLAQHLQRRGHEVIVVVHREPDDLPVCDVVEGVSVARPRFPSPGRSLRATAAFGAGSYGLQRQLDQLGPTPDLVHIQCPSNQTAAVTAFALRRQVPLVLTSQGEVVMDAGQVYQRSRYLRQVLRWSSRRASALSACSQWAVDQAAEFAPAFAHARAIPNGVDVADWEGLSDPVPEPILAAWGRHVPQKGFDLLLAAMPIVRDQVPAVRLLLGGVGPDSQQLRTLAGPETTFLGSLDRLGVRAMLGRARMAVIPSRIEPFGIVALEALAAGRQVVYSLGTGLPEAVGDQGVGVDTTDATLFAMAIVTALRAPIDPAAARHRASTLSWEAVTDRYEELYAAASTKRRR